MLQSTSPKGTNVHPIPFPSPQISIPTSPIPISVLPPLGGLNCDPKSYAVLFSYRLNRFTLSTEVLILFLLCSILFNSMPKTKKQKPEAKSENQSPTRTQPSNGKKKKKINKKNIPAIPKAPLHFKSPFNL